ncbi:MAG: pre-peptidase C-terminal domain-containing protein, partial [Cyanobacteria bacterium J06639_1]
MTFAGLVGTAADPSDYYGFTLRQPARVGVRLNDLSSVTFRREDGQLELVQDSNGNGRQDPDEVIATSRYERFSDTQQIFENVEAGTYFVRVQQTEIVSSPLE